MHDYGREHVVDVEARAHGLADLTQRLQLLDVLRELRAARLELLHELDAVDRHRGLPRERRDDRHLPLVERADIVSPEDERTHQFVVDEHRRAHGGPEPGDLLEIVSAVLRIGQHVRDLLGPPVEPDTADERVAVDGHRVLGDKGDGRLSETRRLDQFVDAVAEEIKVGCLRPAEPARALDDRREDRLGIGGRATHRREHLIGRLELVLQRVEVPSEPFLLLDADSVSLLARCSLGHRLSPQPRGAPGAATTICSVPKFPADGKRATSITRTARETPSVHQL